MVPPTHSQIKDEFDEEFDENSEENEVEQPEGILVDCHALRPGQYLCNEFPNIDPDTQQPVGCQRETGKAPDALECRAAPGLLCKDSKKSVFYKDADCKWTNGYSFDTALLLSIFFGMFGIDRFYLGYPALGLLKFSTLGFFFLGHLLDVILIASQVVGPADKSYYVVSYFGPAVDILSTDNETVRRPQSDWF